MAQLRRFMKRLNALMRRRRDSHGSLGFQFRRIAMRKRIRRLTSAESLESRQVAGSMLLSLPGPLSILPDLGQKTFDSGYGKDPLLELAPRQSKRVGPDTARPNCFEWKSPAKLSSSSRIRVASPSNTWLMGSAQGIQIDSNGRLLCGLSQPPLNPSLSADEQASPPGLGLVSAGIGGLVSGDNSLTASASSWVIATSSLTIPESAAPPANNSFGQVTGDISSGGGGGGISGVADGEGVLSTQVSSTPVFDSKSTPSTLKSTAPSPSEPQGPHRTSTTSTTPASVTNVAPHSLRQVLDFDNNLADWNIEVLGGSSQGRGSVTQGSAILREGDSFRVGLSQEFTVPANPTFLRFVYSELSFDTTDPDSINDAFEAALLDATGKSLVYTLGQGQDAFFNATENENIAAAEGVQSANGTVTLDISGLEPLSKATIAFRLINNDQDTKTLVRITSVEIDGDSAPLATIELEADTAPLGLGSTPYQTDHLTNSGAVVGSVSDDNGIVKVEAQIDAGPTVDITSSVVQGHYRFEPTGLSYGRHQIRIIATDSAGQTGTASLEFRLNVPPTAAAGPDVIISEGAILDLDSSSSSDSEESIFSRVWTFSDGTQSQLSKLSRIYAQNGAFRESLAITDTAGSTAEDSLLVTVENLPPLLDSLPNQVLSLKQPLVVHSLFSDAGIADRHFATINWGDGLIEPAKVEESSGHGWIFASHLYAAAGVYTARLTLRDEDGGRVVRTFTVDVQANPVQTNPVLAVDDREFGYSERGTWQNGTRTGGYKGDFRFALPGTGSKTATWSTRVNAGEYEVFTTWVADNRNATNTPFKVFDSTTLLTPTSLSVDQKSPPVDFSHGGVVWRSLGVFKFAKGLPTIQINDAADGRVVADAIMLASRSPTAPEIKVDLRLANDTAMNGVLADGRTADPTIVGAIGGLNPIVSVKAGFSSPTTELLPKLVDGQIVLRRADLEQLNGGPLVDGPRTLFVQATDSVGQQSKVIQLAFHVDTTISIAMSAPNSTDQSTIQVDVTTEPSAFVTLMNTGEIKSTGTTGFVSFFGVPLTVGTNEIHVESVDRAGNRADKFLSVLRMSLDRDAPIVESKLAIDSGLPFDRITNDPRVQGSISDSSPIAAFTASIDSLDNPIDILSQLRTDGNFTLSTNLLKEIAGGNLSDGIHVLRLTAIDSQGLKSTVNELRFTLDTVAPQAKTPVKGQLIGTISSMEIDFSETMSADTRSAANYRVEQVDSDDNRISLVNIDRLEALGDDSVRLHFASPLESNNQYRVTLSPLISDVAGNALTGNRIFRFGLNKPEVPREVATPGRNQVDFSKLSDVSASLVARYEQTSYNPLEQLLLAEFAIHNQGTYLVDTPLLVVIKNLSDPTVQLRDFDGVTPDGDPYYDLSSFVPKHTLAPLETTLIRSLSFYTPEERQFTYEVKVLGGLNHDPIVTSNPDLESIVGKPYQYNVDAIDADRDILGYTLKVGPSSMTVDPTSGLIQWVPSTLDRGNHSVVVAVNDGRGGTTEQRYTLSAIDPPPNRPPLFTSIPIVKASVDSEYQYLAEATDADGDALTFSLNVGPDGMTLDQSRGTLSWKPNGQQNGTQAVTLHVSDGRGGTATQTFAISVGQQTGNTPPIIISQPILNFDVPQLPNAATGDVTPVHIDLDLPAGASSSQVVSLTLPNLASGKSYADIVFVVDESTSMDSDQAWVAEMLPILDAALEARGIGPNRYSVVGFGGSTAFRPSREPAHPFNLIESASLTLYGPTASTAVANTSLGPILAPSVLETTATTSGPQVLVISDTSSRPGGYRFQVLQAKVESTPLQIGALISGQIDVPTEEDRYTFSLSQSTLLYFDALTNNPGIQWTLVGPAGVAVSSRSFTNSDARFAQNSAIDLVAGDYILTVTGASGVTGPYQFRVFDLATARQLVPGTPEVSTLSPANSTQIYRFSATAGERFYLDILQRTTSGDAFWKLLDPFGNALFKRQLAEGTQPDAGVIIANQAGLYTLLFEGGIADSTIGEFQFNVSPSIITTTSLVPGSVVTGEIANPGEQDRYQFNLTQTELIYFDSLTNVDSLQWKLAGPAGALDAKRFATSDGSNFLGNPVYRLPSGAYTLTVDGINDATGGYAFRIATLSGATLFTPATPVTGSLAPASETDIYAFTASAGDRYSFDLQSRTNGQSSSWRLIDPYGNLVFTKSFVDTNLGDVATITLPQSGQYSLLLEGNVSDTQANAYTFVVVPQGNTPPPPPSPSVPLTLGSIVNASIGAVAEQDRYTFSLPNDSLLYFDSLSNSSTINWSLVGPAGTAVASRAFSNSDGLALNNPVVRVVAGTYTLVVSAAGSSTGNYAFRLSDLASAVSIVPGTAIAGDLNSANETDIYKLNVVAGDKFYFDLTARSAGGSSVWRLIDPYGNVVTTSSFSNLSFDFETLALPQSGTYTLLLEGAPGDTVPGAYSFNVRAANGTTNTLVLGALVSSSLATPGDQDRFTFKLANQTRIYFDALTNNSDLTWTLTGPSGTLVDAMSFTSQPNSVSAPAGDYSLSINLPGDKTADYAFRLFELASATQIDYGATITGTLSPAAETDAYQFFGLAGDRLYFDVLARTSGSQASWKLVDPYGNLIFNSLFADTGSSDVEIPALAQPGVYTLLLDGGIADSGAGNYSFRLQPIAQSTSTLVLGDPINGTISSAGERDNHTFTLDRESLLSFDSMSNSSTLTWSLVGPAGIVVSSRAFSASDGNNASNPVVSLPAGAFTLTVDGTGDAIGNYSFRLSDLSQSPTFTPGASISGTLSPANSTAIYHFDGVAGEQYYFDIQSKVGINGARWRLIDPFGAVLFAGPFTTSSDVDTLTLAASGMYTLLIEGALSDAGVGNFSFNVHPVSTVNRPLILGELTAGSIGVPGERDRFNFALTSPSFLYFDAISASTLVNWTLSGPDGTIVESRPFNFNNGEVNQGVLNLVAGNYTLLIDGNIDATAAYQFRVSDLASGIPLTFGTAVTGSFSPGNETDIYTFDASAGESYFFDQLGRTGGAAHWRLVDPFGNLLFTSSFDNPNNDVDSLKLLNTGRYTLLIEGGISSTSIGTYAFSVQPVAFVSESIVLGSTIAGSIAVAGERDAFTFTLDKPNLLYFDSLTNTGNLNWSLAGPAGVAVQNRSFNFNGGEVNQPLLNLVAGDYTLTVDGSGDSTSGYSFRILTTDSALALTPNNPISGALEPANQTDHYRLSANAYERYTFDLQSRSGGLGAARWRLVDPYGTIVFNTAFTDPTTSDVAAVTLVHPGDYTLLIEGGISDTTIGNYTFAVVPQGSVTPPPPLPSSPITLGSAINDVLSVAGEQDRYAFSLTTQSLLYFDALTSNANISWSLMGPTGTVVNTRSFNSSDAVNVGANPVLNLPKGDYNLVVFSTGNVIGSYAFRLSNLNSATLVTPGVPISDSLSPANETDMYRFNASAGDRLYFDTQIRTNAGNARQRLVDPFGNVLFFSTFIGSDVDVTTLTQSGTYTLLLEGGIADSGIGTYRINIQPAPAVTTALSLGSTIDGSIAIPGEQDKFTFTLADRTLVAFDARTNAANLQWSLTGPSGTVVNSRSFQNSDAANGNPLLALVGGEYTLTIDATADFTTPYAFRLNALESAQLVTPGIPINGTLDPASETDLYRFRASAGDRFFFDIKTRTNAGNSRWRLADPNGNVVFTSVFSLDVDVVTLTQSGMYTLLLEGGIADTSVGAYTIQIEPATSSVQILSLNQPINTALSKPGDQHQYSFAGSVGQRLYFDRLGPTTSNIIASLISPSGNTVFSLSNINDNFGPFFLPESGTYRLIMDGIGDAAGPYGFALYDIASLHRPPSDGDIRGVLNFPLGSDLYVVDADAGQKLVVLPGDDLYVGTAQQVSRTMGALVANGNFEDGYQAIQTSLDLDIYRPGAAINVILVSDEDRDTLDPTLNFTSTFAALDRVDAKLNGVHDAQFRDANNQVVLGVDSHGTAYLADGAGGYTTAPGGKFVSTVRPSQSTKTDYIDLAWALGGAAWDVTLLRGGGLTASSFTKAFVDVKAREIEEQLAIDVVASSSAARIQNLTGPVTGVGAGETAQFNIQFSSDGTPQAFELLFNRPGNNVILGSIPVTINTPDYRYPVQAIDADGDPITFRLLDAPSGATIDGSTGQITWSPPGQGLYHFSVQANDGHGGIDVQGYDLTVTSGAANNNPVILSAAPTLATTGLPFAYPLHATDPDGDLLTYFLTDAPTGMHIDKSSGRIDWTPTKLQSGTINVSLRVLDGRGGQATQSFALQVGIDAGNTPPEIRSAPVTTSSNGILYRYDVVATDNDNDALAYDLVVSPSGMTISPTGNIVWNPSAEAVGKQNVIVRVRDGRGGVDLQSFQLDVSTTGTAPCFSVMPPTADAIVGRPYQYRFQAQDADRDTFTFRKESGPLGLTIDANTGVMKWTPTSEQVGSNGVVITAIDSQGQRTALAFSINAVADTTSANSIPVITSRPRTTVAIGTTYFYQAITTDANNDPLRISLGRFPAGMTIDSDQVIRWQPESTQTGNHPVDLLVDDGHGGTALQSFTLEVTPQRKNASPTITTMPIQTALVGRDYQYPVRGVDDDLDMQIWTLLEAPRGMSIHSTLGTICWHPTPDQVGPAEVVVQLNDGQGGLTNQSFVIQVRALNAPPIILSTPLTQGVVINNFEYAVEAQDPDGDALTYALSVHPAGMTINPRSGLILWSPTTTQIGNNNVVVQVADGNGGNVTQVFGILVTQVATNAPPRFTSLPVVVASVEELYRYAVTASDPENGGLQYGLVSGPDGMTIHPTTGLVQWTPTVNQAGIQSVRLSVTDTAGNVAYQRFSIVAQLPNSPPAIQSSPELQTIAGSRYIYDINAIDPDDDVLAYELVAAPSGMTIDRFGRIQWETKASHIGSHAISIQVKDVLGATAVQNYVLSILADSVPPRVALSVAESPATLGDVVTIFVSATDNVAVESLVLTADGIPVPIDSNGAAILRPTQVGVINLLVNARDAANNLGQDSILLPVVDHSDANAPQVEIVSPAVDEVIGKVIDIVGTVLDDNLQSYRLEVAALGTEQFTEIASGNQTVTRGLLGRFDPTLLQNDTYTLRLTATDTAGNSAVTEQLIHVSGAMKLGDFSLSFTDLTLPAFGVPISVVRTYSTLISSESRDFGYGWRLDFRNMNLRTSVPSNKLESVGVFSPFKTGSRVYLTLPGGERQGFTFRPTIAAGFRGSFLGIFEPRFVPDSGVKSSLTVAPSDLRFRSDGTVYDYATGKAYNPADRAFGGTYLLTTKDGIAYDVDARTGQLNALSDSGDNRLTFTDAGISSSDGRSVAFERDPRGRITTVVDPAGQRIVYRYDSKGDLVSVIDRMNQKTSFTYTGNRPHYLEKVVDPLGRTGARTEYNEKGQLQKLFDASGNVVLFSYDPTHLVNTITDALGHSRTEEYDDLGNIIRQIDALGGVTHRVFDGDSNLLVETNALGQSTTFTYNDRGDVLSKTDPLGNTSFSTYQTFSFGTSVLAATRGEAAAPFTRELTSTDPLGNTSRTAYTSKGFPTRFQDPSGATSTFEYDRPGAPPVSLTDALGGKTVFAYSGGLLTKQIDPLGNETSFTYDANGNQISSSSKLTSATGTVRTLTSTTAYDPEGRIVSMTNSEGGTKRTQYDAIGNPTSVIDELGRRTNFLYDARNLLVETIYPDLTPSISEDNPRTRRQYDANGKEVIRFDESERQTRFTYDGLGRLTKTTYADETPLNLADNPFTSIEYDAVGQIVAVVNELGSRTTYTYDEAGNQVAIRDALGNETHSVFDASGRKVATTDALGRLTQFQYDTRDLPILTTFADGTQTANAFDALGRRTRNVDEDGQATHYEYDALGRLTAIVDALGNRTTYILDEAGNAVRIKDAMGRVTTQEFDGLGRRTATTLPLGQRTSTTYDAVGNIIATKDPNGDTISYRYDARDRMIEKLYPDSSSTKFSYTPTGQRETATDSRGATNYTYDTRDRLTARSEPDGMTIQYRYDAAGNRTAVLSPSGEVTYQFDPLNQLRSVVDASGKTTTYVYDAVGNLTGTTLPGSVQEARQYDIRNRLTYLEQSTAAGVLSSYRYTFTPSGRRATVEESTGRRVSYNYDGSGRLTRELITDAVHGSNNIEYSYDSVGNRLARVDSSGSILYSYDANDRLISELAGANSTQYTYDNNGNTKSRTTNVDQVFYDWDFDNQLKSARLSHLGTSHEMAYRYDVDGLRIEESVDGESTRFLFDTNLSNPEVVLEYRPSGLITASYVRGRKIISQSRQGVDSYYLADGLGSIRSLMNSSGQLTDRYVYDAFGLSLFATGGTENSYRFLGEHSDKRLGLIYLRSRYLNPQIGRFISSDSFPGLSSVPASMHRYLYANADPVNRMDPSGHFVLTIDVSFSAIIQQTLRFLGGAVSADIGNEIGGIPGAIIGAIAGGFAFGRLGSWLTRVEYTATETAAAAKTATAANAGNSSSAAKAAIQNAANRGRSSYSPGNLRSVNANSIGRRSSFAVVPLPAFVDVFRDTRDNQPGGKDALQILSKFIAELVDGAGDPYTAHYYQTLEVSLDEVINPSELPDA